MKYLAECDRGDARGVFDNPVQRDQWADTHLARNGPLHTVMCWQAEEPPATWRWPGQDGGPPAVR